MPKRKADSQKNEEGTSGSKKTRTEDTAAAALSRADLTPRVAVHTLKLADAINAFEGSYTQLMRTVVNLLQKDAARSESLLDLSLVPEGDESCVLFQLLDFFSDCIPGYDDADDVKADHSAAQKIIVDKVIPIMPTLLRSFDPTTVDGATGNNALHELCSHFTISPRCDFDFTLAEQFIAHGVSVHARDNQGRTALLKSASVSFYLDDSADGLRLLLFHGADPNAQDSQGNSVLHHLVQNKVAAVLEALMADEGTARLDFHLVNSAGQTAADLAAVIMAQVQMHLEEQHQHLEAAAQWQEKERRARQIHRLMAAQAAIWTKRVQPALLLCLETVLPVTDLAKLTLGYIDGSGLPFATAAAADDEENEPAAAEAPAATS